MIDDDILQQVRKAKEEYAAKFGFDVYRIGADLMRMDEAGDRPVVRFPPRQPDPLALKFIHAKQADQRAESEAVTA